jgi:hypothetical protein
LDRVGLNVLHSQPFAHGQFYVAMSRVRKEDNIRICAQKRPTNEIWVKNFVDQRIVDKEDIDDANEFWVMNLLHVFILYLHIVA